MDKKPHTLIGMLESSPEIIAHYIGLIPVKELEKRRGEQCWTVKEHVIHLEYVQDIMYDRLLKFKTETHPVITPYFPQDDKIESPQFSSINEVLDSYKVKRAKQIELIKSFQEKDFSKTGQHHEYNSYSLDILLNHILFHDYWHMYRIEELWLTKDAYFLQ